MQLYTLNFFYCLTKNFKGCTFKFVSNVGLGKEWKLGICQKDNTLSKNEKKPMIK